MVLGGVAIFVECNELPWDPLPAFPATLNLNEIYSATLSLATAFESAMGVNVCAELRLQVTDLPPFCTLTGDLLECAPTLPEHAGIYSFSVL